MAEIVKRKTPRDYQVQGVDSLFDYFNNKKGNPLVVMPTGTGKSLVQAMFIEQAIQMYQSTRIINATHSKILIRQNHKELLNWWPTAPAGINSAALKQRDYYRKITFAGIGSVYKDAKRLGHTDLVLVDECHLVGQKANGMYRSFFDGLQEINPYVKFIGFTATPYRTGQGLLTDDGLFTDICFDISNFENFNRLLDEGYLSTLVPKKTQFQLDVSEVGIGNDGDFIKNQLQEAVDKYHITLGALKEVREVGHDKNKWLIFASGIEHCEHIAEILGELGISCRAVHSKKSDAENEESLTLLEKGIIRAVVNNNCLTTGFDMPDIDLIVILRPTRSVNLWVQMLGRGTRPVYAPGFDLTTIEGRVMGIKYGGKPYCLVLDFASNSERLGPINDPVLPKKKGNKGGNAPIKICPSCDTYLHPTVKDCPNCGHHFIEIVNFSTDASTTELIKTSLTNQKEFKTFAITHITYGRHEKLGAKPSVKVTYFCGKRTFTEYLCVEHANDPLTATKNEKWARGKFEEWWIKRTDLYCPNDIPTVLRYIDDIRSPTHIKVQTNLKYPDVVDFCFDGTDFGKSEETSEVPTVEVSSSKNIDVKKIFFDLKQRLK